MWTKVTSYMDASLFFRGITAVMDFLHRIIAGSFIAGFFIGDYNEEAVKESWLGFLLDKILNGLPKFLEQDASNGNDWLTRLLSGSYLFSLMCNALETPLNNTFIRWLLHAFPIVGLAIIFAAAPYLPTMMLAGMLAVVFVFTLFQKNIKIEPVSAAVLVFIFVSLFSGLTSFHPSSSIPIALLAGIIMLSFLLVVNLCQTRNQTDFLFFVFFAASAGTGLVGLYQYFIRPPDMTWVDVELFGEIQQRVIATFGNPNVYGAYLLLAIPLAGALMLYVKNKFYKLVALGVTGLLLINLLLTYSRGCYLALALTAFFFVLLVEKRLIVLSAAGLFVLPFILPATVISRLLSITNLTDSSTSYRIFIWQGTLRILRDFWMTGLGQGIEAYNTIYPYYAFNAVVAPHSHNLYLQIFVETGIVGLVSFIALLAWFFRSQFRFMRQADEIRDKIISAAMVSAVAGFLFQGVFDHVFYNYRVMLVFFLYIGMACAFTTSVGRKKT